MISHFSTLIVLLIISFAIDVHSECSQGQVTATVTKYGTVDTQCVFKNLKVLPGSSFKLPSPDCLECKCTAKSMTCCGFGFAAGTVAAPPGCIAQNDACKLIFVNEKNPSEICKIGKGPSDNKKKPGKPRKS